MKGVGAKNFGMSLETQEIKFLGGISRDFAGYSRQCPKSLRKKKVCVQFSCPKIRGVPKSEFSGSQKRGIKGEVKRGEVVGKCTGLEGGKREGK